MANIFECLYCAAPVLTYLSVNWEETHEKTYYLWSPLLGCFLEKLLRLSFDPLNTLAM